MSVITVAPKHSKKRVTRSRGYRLHPLTDGVMPRSDEQRMRLARTPGGWTLPRDLLADEQAKRSKPRSAVYDEHVMRVVSPFDCSQDTLVKVPSAQQKQKGSARSTKSGNQRKSGIPRKRNVDVDAWIRRNAPTFTGEITPTMRRLARDVMSHQESVAAYVAD